MKKTKKLLSLALIVAVLLSCMTAFDVFALDLVSIKEGTYTIQSKLNSSMVMDVKGGSKSSGANIQLYKSNNSEAQQFVIKRTGSYYTISPKCSGLMLDVKGGSTASGANVQQYKANNTDSQKWMFYNAGGGYYYIRCKVGDKALDVKGGKTSNGTNIQMYNLNLTDSQKWKLVEVKSNDNYTKKANAFLSDSRFKNGTKWGASQRPKISNYSASGCCAYAVDFCKYVFNKDSYRSGKKFTNPKDIKAGDIIKVTNSQHWLVVISRDGNSLKVAEGNWEGKVVVSNGTYTIKNNQLYRNNKKFRTFSAGYHMQ